MKLLKEDPSLLDRMLPDIVAGVKILCATDGCLDGQSNGVVDGRTSGALDGQAEPMTDGRADILPLRHEQGN